MEITIRPNQKAQEEFLKDFASKECLYLGGFGSGKSYSLYRKHLILHMMNSCPSLVVAPTYSDLFRVSVSNIEAALNEWGIKFSTFPNGKGALKFPYIEVLDNPIYLISGSEPHRLVGFEVACAAVDECARVKSSSIPMNDVPNLIRSRIRHPKAKKKQINWATTPEGTDSWCYSDFVENITPERRIYVGSTVYNSALPKDYIDSLQSSYSSKLQAAYLHGQFINASANLQFWAFDRKYVTNDDYVKDDEGKAFVGIDENISPLTMLYGRYTKDKIHFKGEVSISDNANVMQLITRYNSDDKKFDLFGDSSINRRNTIGDRFVDIFIREMRNRGYSITDRVNRQNYDVFTSAECVNKCFEDGKIRINPNCKLLIKDLENAEYKKGTLDTLKGDKDPHRGDVCRYVVYSIFRPGKGLSGFNLSL
jgi:phage terminase large subunit